MIGNDIIDLAQARKESNWQRRGFLDKIFTAHEQQLIRTAADPDQMVWLLWSMKESAYKIAVRSTQKRLFAPLKLGCQLTELNDKSVKGLVCHAEAEYLTKSFLTVQYIATVSISKNVFQDCRTGILPVQARCGSRQAGCLNNNCFHPEELMYEYLPTSAHHLGFDHTIVSLQETLYPQQQPILWEKVKQHGSAALCVPEEEIHFHKDEAGAPWMTMHTSLATAVNVPLSVSHHGRFGAFVIGSQSSVHSRQFSAWKLPTEATDSLHSPLH